MDIARAKINFVAAPLHFWKTIRVNEGGVQHSLSSTSLKAKSSSSTKQHPYRYTQGRTKETFREIGKLSFATNWKDNFASWRTSIFKINEFKKKG